MTDCGRADCPLARPAPALPEDGLAVHVCPACGARRSPDAAITQRAVAPDAEAQTPGAMRLLFRLREAWLRCTLPELTNMGARILDCGAGDGQWLEWLAQRGWQELVAMETNPDRLARARARGLAAFPSLVEAAATQEGGRFDIIFLWHVLEHVDRPAALVGELLDLLAPGGVLVVSQPNRRSLQTRLFGRRSAFVSYGHHLWFFDHASFAKLADSFPGVSIAALPDWNIEYEAFGWLDTLVSAALGEDNLLHATLKKGRVQGLRKWAALALALLALPLAALLVPIALTIPKMGSTLTYCLRPKPPGPTP
ncbi:MAG: class I SAM-dependent methyltransferase [Rhodospirillales bacterium]|nr:class I SAM-dependent methyltransferase [Rhodospirillales bacterium]